MISIEGHLSGKTLYSWHRLHLWTAELEKVAKIYHVAQNPLKGPSSVDSVVCVLCDS